MALRNTADNLKAELLKIKQRAIELQATRKGYADMLSMFIGQKIDEHTVFEKPFSPTISSEINRPEIELFALQNRAFDLQNRLITNKNLPRLSLFLQNNFNKPKIGRAHV